MREKLDQFVEIYLRSAIKPFLHYHEIFYKALNEQLRSVLDRNKEKIADWFTANFITYFRTVMVFPCLTLLAMGYTIAPSIIVLLVDFGDFLDGVVARFWVDVRKEEASLKKNTNKESNEQQQPISPTHSDDEGFEIVTTGSPQPLTSWIVLHRNRTYGGFVDAVCDKAFVVPCWIALLNSISSSGYIHFVQYIVLQCLVLAETASACVRFRAYFTSGGAAAPKVEGFDFSTSAVKADHVGKAKQTFEMVGTALFMLPFFRYFGLCLLILALPLAYESVSRKIANRVIYVSVTPNTTFDHKIIKFWMQTKAMGSKLIVGVTENDKTDSGSSTSQAVKAATTDMILNACSCTSVDEVIAEAPSKVDLMFLEKQGIDYVVSMLGQTKFVTDEVVNENRFLAIGEDGIARPWKNKDESKLD